MSKILISSFQKDSAEVTRRIYERLVRQFWREAVSMEVSHLVWSIDTRLDAHIATCEGLLAVIGPGWMGQLSGWQDPTFVQVEIESALRQQVPVIPVLVHDAHMPDATHLPASLQDLSTRPGLAVRSGADFYRDMDRLIAYLTQQIPGLREAHAKQDPSVAPVDMVKVPQGPFLYGFEKIR